MAIRQRAVQAEAKQQRHREILDAAERLLSRSQHRIANVAEVADEAGLAKGTVYLYFSSKEELLLAIHERRIDEFFVALAAALEGPHPIGIDDILALTRRHLVDAPLFLPLAARCLATLGTDDHRPCASDFRQRMSQRLAGVGRDVERHFPGLAEGEGTALLRHSFALIIGLWQMSGEPARESGSDVPQRGAYVADLYRALRALWEGTVSNAATHRRGRRQ